jgi:ribosomal protein L37AE/L43A
MRIGNVTTMVNNELNPSRQKQEFKSCPQCGRKGLYHIKQQYYRCRYCGTYLIANHDKENQNKKG